MPSYRLQTLETQKAEGVYGRRELATQLKGSRVSIYQIAAVTELSLVLCLITCSAAEGVDELTRTRFINAVEETRERLASSAFSAEVRITHRKDYEALSAEKRAQLVAAGRDPDAVETEEFRFMVSGGMSLEAGSKGPPAEYVTALNRVYAFRIARREQDATFSIEGLERSGDNFDIDRKIQETAADGRALALGSWYVNQEPVDVLVGSPAFHFIDVREVKWHGKNAVRVDFERPDSQNVLRDFGPSYLVCDVNQKWSIVEYELRVGKSATQHVDITLGEIVHGFPVPSRILRRLTGDDKDTVRRLNSDVALLRTPVPDIEFQLTHYGLPEPVFSPATRLRWIWYLSGGIALVAIGFFVHKRRNSRS